MEPARFSQLDRVVQKCDAPLEFPAIFPAIKVGFGFFQTLEAQAFQRRLLRMTNPGFNFAFAVWILNAAGHGDRAVVREHIAMKGIESGIVNVGDEHALAQIVEHDDARDAAQPTKGSFVQFGPDARTGAEGQQTTRRSPAGDFTVFPAISDTYTPS